MWDCSETSEPPSNSKQRSVSPIIKNLEIQPRNANLWILHDKELQIKWLQNDMVWVKNDAQKEKALLDQTIDHLRIEWDELKERLDWEKSMNTMIKSLNKTEPTDHDAKVKDLEEKLHEMTIRN